MKKYSVEYAHIYTNEEIQKERNFEIDILNKLFLEIDREESVLTVMVDDYSFPDPTFNYSEFKNNLESVGHSVDFIIRESQLMEDCDKVISLIENENLKQEIVSYIKTKKKYPCSLFISAWYLVRLGKIQSKLFPENLIAEKLINILPESFRSFEERGFEIIKNTKFSDSLESIENKYFEGRKI